MKDSVLSVSYNDTGNNAIEDNECTCCRRNQSRVKTFQTITVRCIVVCAVLTISNVLFNYTVWNKLNTLSSENEELRSRNVDLQRSIETIISVTQSKVDHGTHSTSDVQTSEDEDVLPPLQRLFLHRNKRDTKNNRRRNRKKRCKNGEQVHSRTQRTTDSINPHFELEGSGTSIDGVFTWNGTVGAGFSAVVQRGYIKGVQILNTGTYRIQAKVAINGRNKGNSRPRPSEPLIAPAVGIYLMKERRRIPEVLDRTWKTQDERGVIRYTSRHHEREPTSTASKLYPLDTIEVSGGYFLEVNDVIYLQRPGDSLYDPNFERFLNDKDHARFVVHKYA